jgi:hypothetical protein
MALPAYPLGTALSCRQGEQSAEGVIKLLALTRVAGFIQLLQTCINGLFGCLDPPVYFYWIRFSQSGSVQGLPGYVGHCSSTIDRIPPGEAAEKL